MNFADQLNCTQGLDFGGLGNGYEGILAKPTLYTLLGVRDGVLDNAVKEKIIRLMDVCEEEYLDSGIFGRSKYWKNIAAKVFGSDGSDDSVVTVCVFVWVLLLARQLHILRTGSMDVPDNLLACSVNTLFIHCLINPGRQDLGIKLDGFAHLSIEELERMSQETQIKKVNGLKYMPESGDLALVGMKQAQQTTQKFEALVLQKLGVSSLDDAFADDPMANHDE